MHLYIKCDAEDLQNLQVGVLMELLTPRNIYNEKHVLL